MFGWLRWKIRHPLYPHLRATPAVSAAGRHAAIAGDFAELERAAGRGATATRAVFLLQGLDDLPAAVRQRDLLWEWFGVPSFVLLVDAEGKPRAYECEAQEGLHVAPGWAASSELEEALCPCGRPGPRVRSAATHQPQCALPPRHEHPLLA